MPKLSNTNIIDLDSKREKNFTVFVMENTTKQLVAFLSIESSFDNLIFTDNKNELELLTEQEAKKIRDSINNGEFNTVNLEEYSAYKFEIGKVEYQ